MTFENIDNIMKGEENEDNCERVVAVMLVRPVKREECLLGSRRRRRGDSSIKVSYIMR